MQSPGFTCLEAECTAGDLGGGLGCWAYIIENISFPEAQSKLSTCPILILTGFCSSPPHLPQEPHPDGPSRGWALTSVPGFLRLAFLMALLLSTSSLATEKVPTCSDKEWGREARRGRWWDRTIGPNRQAWYEMIWGRAGAIAQG